MIKRVIPVLLALMLFPGIALQAFAHDVPQERNDCAIEIQVHYDGEQVSGGTLTAVRVGYVDEDDGNYFFRRISDDILLEEIDSAAAASQLREFYNANRNTYDFEIQTVSVKDGTAQFENLQTGLYLIVQDTPAPGFSKVGAFLISLPYLSNGTYQYQVTAAVKSELDRQTETVPTKPTEPSEPMESTTPKPPKLPQTGQLNWPVPLLVTAGLGMIVLGLILRRKKEDYET